MFALQKNTAILIFTRTAEEESFHKLFHAGLSHHDNTLIAGKFIVETINTVKATGLEYFTTYSNMQHGKSFGERLINSMDEIYKKGFDNIIAIGNDCPELTPARLIEAADRLQETKVVLGPAKDGGVYLIGINKQAFVPSAFIQASWKSKKLMQSLLSILQSRSFSFSLLESEKDIDDQADLMQVIYQSELSNAFTDYIRRIIQMARKNFAVYKMQIWLTVYSTIQLWRSPPAHISVSN